MQVAENMLGGESERKSSRGESVAGRYDDDEYLSLIISVVTCQNTLTVIIYLCEESHYSRYICKKYTAVKWE